MVDFWVGPGVDFGRSGGRFLSIFGSTLGGQGVDFGPSGGRCWPTFFFDLFLTGRPGRPDPRFTGLTRMGPPVYRSNPSGTDHGQFTGPLSRKQEPGALTTVSYPAGMIRNNAWGETGNPSCCLTPQTTTWVPRFIRAAPSTESDFKKTKKIVKKCVRTP